MHSKCTDRIILPYPIESVILRAFYFIIILANIIIIIVINTIGNRIFIT